MIFSFFRSFRGIVWTQMQKWYNQRDMTAINYPIVDMDIMDMSSKLQHVSEIIKLLIQKHEVLLIYFILENICSL